MTTRTMRVPEELHAGVMRVSGLIGENPGTLLHAAFAEYVERHRPEILQAFEHAKKYVLSQDVEGLRSLAGESREERAHAAAEAARSGSNGSSTD